MAETSGIAWTHATFNPWSGCSKVSPACKHCYAERDTKRYGLALWGEKAERQFRAEAYWRQPEKWNREAEKAGERRRVFCASLADVFEIHRNPETNAKMNTARSRLWKLIESTPWLDWLLLTKRPQNILALVPLSWSIAGECRPGGDGFGCAPRNVWLGVTAESQEYAEKRVPFLLAAKQALGVRVAFVSHEPAVGPVDFTRLGLGGHVPFDALRGGTAITPGGPRLDWIITGGESGPGARSYDVAWARSVIAQCRASTADGYPVAAFVKQLGAVAHETHEPSGAPDDGGDLVPLDDLGRAGSDFELLQRVGLGVREFPAVAR